ncbi:MAG TPA: serine hydrolase domain-containing protein, partial [Gemmatimonadota bacterium]|nr:serine hydrolase domain-containing protein [Gemmatimonadota bacterium]
MFRLRWSREVHPLRRGAALLRIALTTLSGLLFLSPALACAQSQPEQLQLDSSQIDSGGLRDLVDAEFEAGMAREKIPGAAFILVQDGRVVLSRGYGNGRVDGPRVSSEKTIFPIASISKVFTATALMQLVDRGVVDLDADVNRYLTATQIPSTYPQPVTARHLLSHTAGFDELPGRRVRTAAELMPLARFLGDRLVRVHAPGEVTSYSSYGMALSGLVVEDVSGVPFEEYLERHIWQPLRMARTSITLPAGNGVDLATAYE